MSNFNMLFESFSNFLTGPGFLHFQAPMTKSLVAAGSDRRPDELRTL